MHFWTVVFVVSCLIVFYNYAGYALILFIVNTIRGHHKKHVRTDVFPTVSFIVAAFNEEDCIEKKILNSLEQDYPADRMEFIFITDGSTDHTMDIIRQYPSIRLLHQPGRLGKSAALNRSVLHARHDILIFSDANTILNEQATRNITRHYQDNNVGGVAGEKKVITQEKAQHDVGTGEGLYWKYESMLKQLDSDFYSVVGAAGELFSLRKDLFEPVPDSVILDDFIISMKVAARGYRIIYEPEAFAMELPSFSIEDEQKRKVRIAAGGFQAMVMLRSLFLIWNQPALSFLYISHRVLRWTLSPVSMVLAFVSNALLAFSGAGSVFVALFLLQCAFYAMAILPVLFSGARQVKLFRLAYYFVFMNVSVVQGFFRFLRGKQPSAWEKARRKQPAPDTEGAKEVQTLDTPSEQAK